MNSAKKSNIAHSAKPLSAEPNKSRAVAKLQLENNGQQFINAIDPVTQQVIGKVQKTDEARIPGMVAQARIAQESWGRLHFSERSKALSLLRDLIKRRSQVSETISRGMGKPLVEALA